MKNFLFGAALMLAAHLPAQAAEVTILGGPGAIDERGGTNQILGGPMQWVYAGSSFGTEAIRISSMALRFDQGYSRMVFPGTLDWTTHQDFYIKLGVVSGMGSNLQAENRNATLKTVLAGVKTMPIFVGADEHQTKPWGIQFTFDTPFDYDPNAGNLLLDAYFVRGPEYPGRPGQFAPLTVDAIYASSYGRGIGYWTEQRGDSYNLLVAKFTVGDIPPTSSPQPGGALPGVPEPASWALMIGGFGLVGGAMRRRTPRLGMLKA